MQHVQIGARFSGAAITAVFILTACTSGPAPRAVSGDPASGAGSGGQSTSSGTPKTLRMGMLAGSEPTSGIVVMGQSGTGPPEHGFMLHAGLTNYDEAGTLQPWIATSVPSLENGAWQVAPDGRMDVTWKLRPGVRWHDGTPLTAADFVFGLRVQLDPELPTTRAGFLNLISSADAPDDSTLVIHWKQPYILGNAAGLYDVPAVPRHIMADLYASDKQATINNPYWTTQFVGLGPYRMSNWSQGTEMAVVANDQYFLGRPKIDRVIVKYFGDVNGVVAGVLSGDIDVAPVGALKASELVTLKNQWEANGAGTTLPGISGTRNYRFQYRDPAAPWVRDARVRQALSSMLDRQAIVDTLIFGLTTPAYTILPTDDPVYKLLE
ncbi:MAG: peptide/nickel transport system substrate-binding protein, partial [Chloroflexota bacterium]|nr:peptide/nickel transport system substrate-binding protein [Chloroflexota bacterium]